MENKIGVMVFATILLSVLFVGLASAQTTGVPGCQVLKDSGRSPVGESIPESAPFTDEVFNVYVSEDFYASINLTNKSVTGFECSENENATYNARIEGESVINDFRNSDNLLDTYNAKRESGEIEIEGTNFGRNLKIKVVNFFSQFFWL